MRIDQFIEHRYIPLDQNHTPFRWSLKDEVERLAFKPRERYKLMLQQDTHHAFVSDNMKFYPIGLDLPPNNHNVHYGVRNNEWTRIVLPTDDTFKPYNKISEVVFDTPYLEIDVDFSRNIYYILGKKYFLSPEKALTLKISSYPFNEPIIVSINIHPYNYYFELTHLDCYIINDTDSYIGVIIPEHSETRRFPLESKETFRIDKWFNSANTERIDIEYRNYVHDSLYPTLPTARAEQDLVIDVSNIPK